MNDQAKQTLSKVPEVTIIFWIIKIAATTLGETGGDTLSMSMDLGYLLSTGIFAALFAVAVIVQIGAKKFHPRSIGSPLSQQRPLEPRWLTSPIDRWELAMQGARPCS